jgi:hypothetical protein
MKKIFIFIIMWIFCGCANLSVSGIDAPKGFPTNNTSIIYVIRDNATPIMAGVNIMIDGAKIGVLSNKSFTWVETSPGERTIVAKWSFIAGQEDSIVNIHVGEGKIYYIILRHDFTTSKGIFNPYVMYNKFIETDESLALGRMKEMKYIKSK